MQRFPSCAWGVVVVVQDSGGRPVPVGGVRAVLRERDGERTRGPGPYPGPRVLTVMTACPR